MRLGSLTTRFVLTLLLSTAVPFLALGLWVREGIRDLWLRDHVEVNLPKDARDTADQVDDYLREAHRLLSVIAPAAALALEPNGDVEEFVAQVTTTPGVDHHFDLILLCDARDGRVVRIIDSGHLDSETKAARQAAYPDSVADTEWFQGARAKGQHWVNLHRSPLLHRSGEARPRNPTDHHVGLAFALPPGTSAPRGVLYGLIRWQPVQEVLEQTKAWLRGVAGLSSAEVMLCDGDGIVLAHTDRRRYGTDVEPTALRERILAGEAGHLAYSDPGRGCESHAGFAPVPNAGEFRWHVALFAPRRELFARVDRFGRALLLAIAITAVMLVAWSLVASRAIVRPVHRLAAATDAIARGNLDVRVAATGRHELADLGRAFNSMAEDLAHSREELRAAERQAAWAEMARQIAHEIKNPLTPMRMGAQLLLKARREEDDRWPQLSDRLARTVLQQTDALARIAEDFRQFAGPPSRQLQPVRADDLLRDAEAFLAASAEAQGLQLRFGPGAGDAQVAADEQEMRRVLLNLVQNAIEACGTAGTVAVDSRTENGSVVFEVADTGPGISDDLRRRLFEPYFTTKSSGTGLGLAICRRIVEAHGGRIRLAASAPGHTVFRVELPAL